MTARGPIAPPVDWTRARATSRRACSCGGTCGPCGQASQSQRLVEGPRHLGAGRNLERARPVEARGAARLAPAGLTVSLARWYWGADIEPVTIACGWTLLGWAAPLLDPAPCSGASRVLPWRLAVGSTGTIELPSGEFRMYFAKGRLEQWTDDATRAEDRYPVVDGAGNEKFSRSRIGEELSGTKLDAWWRAETSDGLGVPDLCFASGYISFLDSSDGRHFPLYAPRVTQRGLPAGACGYSRPVVSYGNADTGFRAGWRSTVIPCSGPSPVYRDPTVVFLPASGIYVMLVVECRSTDPTLVDDDVIDDEVCNLCSPSACLGSANPTTDPVFFACRDPSFQSGVAGPFAFLASSPDPTSAYASFVGVPQVLLTPSGAQVLVHAKAGDWNLSGLSICDAAELGAALAALLAEPTAAFSGDAAEAAVARELGRSRLSPLFVSLGDLQVSCNLPGLSCPPVTVDEELVFCGDRLHLYFTAKLTCSPADPVPLSVVGHAVAALDAEPGDLAALIPGSAAAVASTGGSRSASAVGTDESTGTTNLAPWLAGGTGRSWLGVASERELARPPELVPLTGDPGDAVTALTEFSVAPCNPVEVTDLTGGAGAVSDLRGQTVDAELNDPDVFENGTGGYTMLVHSRALGGTVVFVAPRRVACDPRTSC